MSIPRTMATAPASSEFEISEFPLIPTIGAACPEQTWARMRHDGKEYSISFDNSIRCLIDKMDLYSGYESFSNVDSPMFSFVIDVVRSIGGVQDYLPVRSPREFTSISRIPLMD
jgi:hypothetical protein